VFQLNAPSYNINAGDIAHQYRDIPTIVEYRTDRLGNFGSGQPSGGHLIQQRLEQVMILPVHERDGRVDTKRFGKMSAPQIQRPVPPHASRLRFEEAGLKESHTAARNPSAQDTVQKFIIKFANFDCCMATQWSNVRKQIEVFIVLVLSAFAFTDAFF